MALKTISEVGEQRDGKTNLQPSAGTEVEYSRTFFVEMDSALDDAGYVLSLAGIPQELDPYVTPNFADPRAICKTRNCTQVSGQPFVWQVVCKYDNRPYFMPCSNPLTCPPKVSYSFQRGKEVMEQSQDGKAILNSAGMPLILEREYSTPMISIEWASVNYDPTVLADYKDAINDDDYAVPNGKGGNCAEPFDRNVLKIEGFTVTSDYDIQYGFFYKKQMHLAVDSRYYWQGRVLDVGTHEIKLLSKADLESGGGGSNKLRPIRDTTGHPVPSPGVPLDGNGQRLPYGATPVWLSFKKYKEIDFSSIIDWPSV